ncbi:MAG: hypothetical protein HOE73_06315 [Bacteroidetes Order II. Incertae sedis bacterium]|nr:hypothetical protein [Bacteroidetes Order II. bacterium]
MELPSLILRANQIPFIVDQMKRILGVFFASGAFPHYHSFEYQAVSFLPNVDFVFAILIVGRCTIRIGHD